MDDWLTNIITYFFAFAWGLYIFAAFIGWGGVVNRILFPQESVDWGQKGAWGCAFSIFIGGILNLTWMISKEIVLTYLVIGFIYALLSFYKSRRSLKTKLLQYIRDCQGDSRIFWGTTILLLLLLLFYTGSLSTNIFNLHDDFHAYFVFPNQMLQMGAMGPDPFSARRIYSLGGKSFLDTFVLSTLSEKNLNIIDSGVGLFISIGVLLSFCRERRLKHLFTIFTILCFLLIRTPQVNITSVNIALALFLSLYRVFDWSRLTNKNFVANGCIIALITAALCALKSSFVIPCTVFFGLKYLYYFYKTRLDKKYVYEFLVFIGLSILFLLPWMISMHESSGTFLYPFLGKGYHGSVYGTFAPGYSDLTMSRVLRIIFESVFSLDVLALIWLFFFVFVRQEKKLIRRNSPLFIFTSSILGKLSLSLAAGGYGAYRYSFPFVIPGVLILLIFAFENSFNKVSILKSKSLKITLFFIFALITGLGIKFTDINRGLENIGLGLIGSDVHSTQEVASYTNLLESIPPKQTVLTRLSKPYLLDFTRNKVFLADYPGEASLPPGMPFFEGSEKLANYLISKSIKYVAYSYANEANFRFEDWKGRLRPTANTWLRTEAEHTFDFQNNLKQLGETRVRVFDDGNNFMIDLSRQRE